MSESLSGHEILNDLGQRIRVTARTLRSLDQRHYLRRDRATGLLQVTRTVKPLLLEIECGDRQPIFMRELGRDISGPAVCVCHCLQCQKIASDIDHTRLPGSTTLEQDEATKIVAEIKAKRSKRVV
jgi:hypothetical protein